MARRAIHLMLITGLMLSALFSATAAGAAEDGRSDAVGSAAAFDVYLPWLPNAVSLDGDGEFYGTMVVQNLESVSIEADILIGTGAERSDAGEPRDWDLRRQLTLLPYQSVTLDAFELHVPRGTGASAKVRAVLSDSVLETDSWAETGDVPAVPARIAALVKTSGPVTGFDAITTDHHTSVDGYTGLTVDQVNSPSNAHIVPIVQNNSGWETIVRIAHMGDFHGFSDDAADVAVRLYEAGSSGALADVPVVALTVRPGGVTSFSLSDHVESTEWVGSAVIESDVPLGAIAERVKHSDNMLVTVVSRPEQFGNGPQYAPLVFKDYNDWNTGISVANTNPGAENEITVTYYGPNSEAAGTETITIPPRGMNFIHSPGGQDGEFDVGFVGSAMITGTTSFHAVVDQVKYGDASVDAGQAMSYVLEHEAAAHLTRPDEFINRIWNSLGTASTGTMLTLPLVQRGDAESTGGDISGIQLFNTSSERTVRLEIVFYSSNGIPVSPTAAQGARNPMLVSLGPNQSYTLYTPSFPDMPAGFQGSAIIEVVGGGGSVVGISNNVNYDVSGDGSAAYSLVSVPPAWDVYESVFCVARFICD